jgi:hypothetical protein
MDTHYLASSITDQVAKIQVTIPQYANQMKQMIGSIITMKMVKKVSSVKKWTAQEVALSAVGFYSLLQKIRTLGIERGCQHTKSDQHDLYAKLYDIHQYNVDR